MAHGLLGDAKSGKIKKPVAHCMYEISTTSKFGTVLDRTTNQSDANPSASEDEALGHKSELQKGITLLKIIVLHGRIPQANSSIK